MLGMKTKDPFIATAPTPKGLVQFWVERPTHLRIGKRTALSYLKQRLGDKIGAAVYKNGFFLVDTPEDAAQCVAEMKSVRDSSVSQYVFGARAFTAQD